METKQLAAFCAVVERRSFSQAAAALGVTQPAVSQQVRALERRVGQQLLDRSGRRVVPTDAGQRLYRSAQRMLAAEEQLLSGLTGTEDGELTGTLEIGASTGPAAIVVPLLLGEFAREHPRSASSSRSTTRRRSSRSSPSGSSSSASSERLAGTGRSSSRRSSATL